MQRAYAELAESYEFKIDPARLASTVVDHPPPEARAHLRQTPAWCQEQAEVIGPACRELVEHLFADRIVDRLRAARSLIWLRAKFGRQRLEAA